MEKDKRKKDADAGKEPIAILRNNAGKFIAYIYEEDTEFFNVDAEMSDYYVERLNKGEKHGKRETDYQE